MRRLFTYSAAVLLAISAVGTAASQDRYGSRPPLIVSPDLSAPWVMQLRRSPDGADRRVIVRPAPEPRRVIRRRAATATPEPKVAKRRAATVAPEPRVIKRRTVLGSVAGVVPKPRPRPQMDPKYLPATIEYDGPQEAGTIVIDTNERYLYHVLPGGKARRYGVGVGKPGFEWAGTHQITQKREWPDWRPPKEMIERELAKGRVLPVHMDGGPANPLGARALYLGSTLYRIHGTNAPWTIGGAVSSGCIRMRNEDVIELYNRVSVGTKVVVI